MSNEVKTIENPFGVARQNTGVMANADQTRVQSEVMAMVLMARQLPRDKVQAFDRIANAFAREKLAAQGCYAFARGGSDISGLSIRAAETIAQEWGNVQFGFRELRRDVNQKGVNYSEVEAYCWDMETNSRRQLTFIVNHWRDTKKGGYALTDERDIYELIANQAQRRVRSCILAIIPSDVCEAAERQIELTLTTKVDTSAESVNNLVAAFEKFGVGKEQIEERIQRKALEILPAQFIQMRKIYKSLSDGVAQPSDFFNVQTNQVAANLDLISDEIAALQNLDELKKYSSKMAREYGKNKDVYQTISALLIERKAELEAQDGH